MTRKVPKKRPDLLLVERGLAESREKAQALILEGIVYTPAGRVLKPGVAIASDAVLEVRGALPYVSRGGTKLAHALDRFRLEASDITALDVGASTGGFTDCLLKRGARKVFALDVGHGQLDYRLRQDPRVVGIERVNARYPFSLPTPAVDLGGCPAPVPSEALDDSVVEIATVDVSFISVTKVIPAVVEHVRPGGPIVVLVKPQFEARRDEVGRGGVIRDPQVHAKVLARVIVWAVKAGFRLRNLVPSPVMGDKGNREFFLLLEGDNSSP